MANKIGPTFFDECRAANIDLNGWSINTLTGELMWNPEVSEETRRMIGQVLKDHDPTKQPG